MNEPDVSYSGHDVESKGIAVSIFLGASAKAHDGERESQLCIWSEGKLRVPCAE